MFSHVMVGTNDLERSKRFYDAVLGVLGVGEPHRNVNATGLQGCSTAMTTGPSA